MGEHSCDQKIYLADKKNIIITEAIISKIEAQVNAG